MPFSRTSRAGGEAASSVAGLSKASRSPATLFNCASTTSSRSSSRMICAFRCTGRGPTVTGPQVFQPLTPTLAQRLVAEDPLGEEQPFDPVDVPHPPADQRPALPAAT